ncbi:LOW QUALITY PROTEIN: hypothetical protein CH63R_02256 [Colletotrichum higginsianum IMI 349063]|uniref:Uncharacterized protein n=1 Tax=Colletotrichum higginsianum (strain IMI 349063) TaxID=759273 RepID=A0A1B7YNB7_COLHI|nr:LOW QUALITY PROTEIN: hypothetical protein CH63R_02256 [Colletotrichum higginsianum IMI 349063]OBR13530.1 LOW QUALITY PROTEIN: hypothetical protein CH63R_02256 [Colletotrichum higginsianum IMI 349063]GJC95803.1 hypothetical protein ColKHC_04629 [Colletotrichum higginsianum]
MAFFRDGSALDDGDDQQFQSLVCHDSAHPVCDLDRFRLAYAGLHGDPDSNRRAVEPKSSTWFWFRGSW